MLEGFTWREPADDSDRKLISDIKRTGCHIVGIPADEHSPGFAFSIGMYLNYQQPEVMVFSLPWDVAQSVINSMRERFENGHVPKHKGAEADLIEGFDMVTMNVHPEFYREYFGTAIWFYKSIGAKFPMMQLVWPDKKAFYPWDKKFTPKYKALQPVLAVSI
ncbi:MAG: DUF4262 domain-containing protein [Verrucomicrobiota bacterium]